MVVSGGNLRISVVEMDRSMIKMYELNENWMEINSNELTTHEN